jgi:hypothetical protein
MLEYCAFSELHPASAGLELLSGRSAVPSTQGFIETLGYSIRPFHGLGITPFTFH